MNVHRPRKHGDGDATLRIVQETPHAGKGDSADPLPGAQGREKVGARTREGLGFEKQFGDVTTTLLQHLRNQAECRDLMQEFLNTAGTPQPLESIEPKGGGAGPLSRA